MIGNILAQIFGVWILRQLLKQTQASDIHLKLMAKLIPFRDITGLGITIWYVVWNTIILLIIMGNPVGTLFLKLWVIIRERCYISEKMENYLTLSKMLLFTLGENIGDGSKRLINLPGF